MSASDRATTGEERNQETRHGETTSDDDVFDRWVCLALAIQVLIVGAGCAVSTTSSMYSYKDADGQSVAAVCDEGRTSEDPRWLESECGTRILRYTGEAACEAGAGFGCGIAAALSGSDEGLSEALGGGDGVPSMSQKAQNLASRGCGLDDQTSCLLEFSALASSRRRADMNRAIRLGERKCSESMPVICQYMGTAFKEGARTSRDRKKAVEYFRTACEGEFAPGCRMLGEVYSDGFGVNSNQTRAKKHYSKACELGDQKACEKVGEEPGDKNARDRREMYMASMNISNEDIFKMAKKGCNNGFTAACTFFGRVIERGEFRGRYVGIDQAVELYETGCDNGAPGSCYRLGAYVSRTDRSVSGTERALSLARKACDQQVDGACDLRRKLQARSVTEKKTFVRFAKRCESETEQSENQTGGDSAERAAAAESSADGEGGDTDSNADSPETWDLERFEACHIAGIGYELGKVVERNPKRSVSLYRQACDLDHATACWRAGELLRKSDELEPGDQAINTLYRRGCDGGSMVACDKLGRRLAGKFVLDRQTDESSDVPDDLELGEAETYLEKACDARYGKSCAKLATLLANKAALANMIENMEEMEGVKITAQGSEDEMSVEARRESLLKRGCASGYVPACRRLGIFYIERAQTSEEYRRAVEMLSIGCHQDDAKACAHLGMQEVEFDDAELREMGHDHLETACIGGSGLGCRGLGDGYYNGSFVEKDREKSAELYTQACERGSGAGCVNLARQYEAGDGVEHDPAKARKHYETGCDQSNGAGCRGLARMYLYGAETDYDQKKGEKFLQRGCNMGHDQSCYDLEQFHTSGIHKSPSFSDAADALNAGCVADSITACDRLANYYYLGYGTEQDNEAGDGRADRVGEMIKRQCETFGLPSMCVRYAHHLAHGHGTETDNPRARNFLESRCSDNENGPSCAEVADLKAQGHIFELERVAATENLRAMCDEENEQACSLQAYYQWHGGDADLAPEQAVSYYRSECDGDASIACRRLARAYLTGFGARRAPERAMRLLEPMCRPGNEEGCIPYASGLIGMQAAERASRRIDRSDPACENRHAPHCVVSGKLRAAGVGVERDLDRARKQLGQACLHGIVYACPSADVLTLYVNVDEKRSKLTKPAECKAGAPDDCLAAGVSYQYGIERSRDPERAAKFYERACEQGSGLGCAARVSMHRFREANLAGDPYLDYVKKSCEARSADFCYAVSQATSPFNWKVGVELAKSACKNGEKRACLWLIDRGESPPTPQSSNSSPKSASTK